MRSNERVFISILLLPCLELTSGIPQSVACESDNPKGPMRSSDAGLNPAATHLAFYLRPVDEQKLRVLNDCPWLSDDDIGREIQGNWKQKLDKE